MLLTQGAREEDFVPCGRRQIKGKGSMLTYVAKARSSPSPARREEACPAGVEPAGGGGRWATGSKR